MKVVEFKDFSLRYLRSEERSLKNINVSFEKGTTVGLLGPAGAGKTTFLKALMGIVPHIEPGYIEGSVTVNGLDNSEHKVAEIARRVALVLENPDVQIFSLTVGDDVAFGPKNLGMPAEDIIRRVERAMQETGIVALRDRNPNDLSGGQQQTLAIAGAVAMEPKVLAMDEPTAMLDPVGKDEVMSVVERITKGDTQATTVIAESGADLEALAGKLDQVVVLDKGEVILDGPAEEVLIDAKINEVGIGRPQVTELFVRLRDAGAEVPNIPVSLDQAAESLRRLLVEAGVDQLQVPADYGRPDERSPGEPVVRIRNLHHTYRPNVRALRGVDLDIHQGELLGIIGQNGSGKTTMCYHLVKLLKPSNKDAVVEVLGQSVQKLRLREVIGQINYIFQNPDEQIFADRVRDEIGFAPMMMEYGEEETKQAIEEALDIFNLRGHGDDYTMKLPQDLKTYLSIACIYPLRPKVYIIDEPTTGLDTHGIEVMMGALRVLRDAGHTIAIVTHDMETVARHCDRAAVMLDGQVLMVGTTREVFAQPERLIEADIKPPQITQLGHTLSDTGMPMDVLTVPEMANILLPNLGLGSPVRRGE